jgi:hypothetical protein
MDRDARRSRHARLGGALAVVAACITVVIASVMLTTPGTPTRSGARVTLTAAKHRGHRKPKIVRHWVPAARTSWQWELDHPLNLGSASDMGTNGTLYTGGPAPAPQVYDIDGFDNGAATVNRLHALHKRVICYLSVGTWETWRSDASRFPAALRGSADPGWSGEQWLNISPRGRYYRTLQAIMYSRLVMCKAKHFDGVELDNIDVAENSSGFPVTIAQDNAYVTWHAARAHALGLAVGQKNYLDQSRALVRSMDFLVSEQCYQYGACGQLATYRAAHKAIFEAEYSDQGADPASYCQNANAVNLNAVAFATNLDGSVRVTCR